MKGNHRSLCAAAICAGLSLAACPSKVLVPPRLDLGPWPRLGIIEFHHGPDPALGRLATREFIQMVQAAQPGSRILELGTEDHVLSQVRHTELNFDALKAIGDRFEIDAIFVGDLDLTGARPSLRVGNAMTSMKARADVTGVLTGRLLETRSGATVWSRSSKVSANVARVKIAKDQLPSFGVTDPRRVSAGLVPQLVYHLRHDFYASWQKQ